MPPTGWVVCYAQVVETMLSPQAGDLPSSPSSHIHWPVTPQELVGAAQPQFPHPTMEDSE